MAFKRAAQAAAVNNPIFKGMIEASLMVVSYQVKQGRDNPNYGQRVGLTNLLYDAGVDASVKEGIIRQFAWWAVNDLTIQSEAYAKTTKNPGGVFFPEQISDEALDAAVLTFWDTAANVEPITTSTEPVSVMEPLQGPLLKGKNV